MEVVDVLVDDLVFVDHLEEIDSLVGNKCVSVEVNSDAVSVLNDGVGQSEVDSIGLVRWSVLNKVG